MATTVVIVALITIVTAVAFVIIQGSRPAPSVASMLRHEDVKKVEAR